MSRDYYADLEIHRDASEIDIPKSYYLIIYLQKNKL